MRNPTHHNFTHSVPSLLCRAYSSVILWFVYMLVYTYGGMHTYTSVCLYMRTCAALYKLPDTAQPLMFNLIGRNCSIWN